MHEPLRTSADQPPSPDQEQSLPRRLTQRLFDRLVVGEHSVEHLRLLNTAVNTILFVFVLDDRYRTVPWLGHVLLGLSWLFGLQIYRVRQSRRSSVLQSIYGVAVLDSILSILWLYATGGFDSPFYVALYVTVAAFALKYSLREALWASAIYGGSYLLLLILLDQVRGHGVEIAIRLWLLVFTAMLGSGMARRILRQATARVRDEEVARSAASRYLAAIVESSTDSVVAADPNGLITMWNGAAERIYGYTASEVLGKHVGIVTPAEKREESNQLVIRTRRGERIANVETLRLTKDGRLIDVSMTLFPVFNDTGAVMGTAAITRDITEQKRAREELQAKHLELTRSHAELEQFSYAVSHDLREPLRVIAGYLELLARRYQGQLDERADKYIHQAVDGATRMQQLIDDLLAFARVGAGQNTFMPVDLVEVVDETLRNLEAALRDSGGQVTCAPLPTVHADRAQLVQLFQNLIGNALKFRSDEPARVKITAERRGNDWMLAVEDNGIGVDPTLVDKIFGVFQRGHTRDTYPGSGIGLAIAKKIVEQHGGRIWVEPAPERGARFCFTLPVYRPTS